MLPDLLMEIDAKKTDLPKPINISEKLHNLDVKFEVRPNCRFNKVNKESIMDCLFVKSVEISNNVNYGKLHGSIDSKRNTEIKGYIQDEVNRVGK